MTWIEGGITPDYTYDALGRMVTRPDPSGVGTQSLSWDVLSNLTGAGGETYLYDGSGQRVARITDGAATVWVGSDELTDPDTDTASTGDVTGSRYYTLGSSTVAVRHGDAAGTVPVVLQLVLGDVQGSAQVTVDATLSSGAVVAATGATSWSSSAYGPYGVTRDSDNLDLSRGWLGQVEDITTPGGGTGTGLTYLDARYYDPVIGRFLSPDPLMDPGDPRTLDPYRYADNNPIVFMDPTGLWPEWVDDGFAMWVGSQYASGELVVGVYDRSNVSWLLTPDRHTQAWQADITDFTTGVRDNGVWAQVNVTLNPVYHVLDSGDRTIQAAQDRDYFGVGYHANHTGVAALSTAAIAAPGATLGVRAVTTAAARVKPALSNWLSRRATSGGRDTDTVVIGRGMDWVQENAQLVGAGTYSGTPSWVRTLAARVGGESLLERVDLAHNRWWIRNQMNARNTIVDVGWRPGTTPAFSPNYVMELAETRNYPWFQRRAS